MFGGSNLRATALAKGGSRGNPPPLFCLDAKNAILEALERITRECMDPTITGEWRCVKSYYILLWEEGVKRITIWGQSLESESPEAQSHGGPAERPDSSAECPQTPNLLVPDPVLKSVQRDQSPERPEFSVFNPVVQNQ